MSQNKLRHPSDILGDLANYYRQETRKLIYHLYSKGYTVQKVADILGVTRQAVDLNYPKGVRNHEV